MRRTRLLLPVVAAALALPLAATAATGSKAPQFQTYTSPGGSELYTGIPQPLGDVVEAVMPFGIYTQAGLGDSCGEPTLAVHPKTGDVLYQCGLQTLRVTGLKDGRATWTPVQAPVESLQSSDPILRMDRDTGRVFVNQLMPQGCSLQAYSDDFGTTWTQSAIGCSVGISFDHQTIGAGKPTTLVPALLYKNVIYYCTNDLVALQCGTSLDGGLTYGPAHPVNALDDSCSAIVGHIKSAPDGTTYLMPDGCSDEAGKQAVYVTTDNALTWTKRSIPRSTQGDAGHPSLGVGKDGTVYAAWGSSDNDGKSGRVHVAVSRSKGQTWTAPVALGKDKGVKVSRFPLAVAGDGDRAAVAFLGSTSGENPASKRDFVGAWHLYVAFTYDRGRTWKTYNATPASPVQVGSICTGGLACDGDRNLLDFNDMVLDGKGRVVIAFADGCLKTKGCTTKDRLKKGALVRQESGLPLLR